MGFAVVAVANGMQPHSEGIPSTVALLSDELLLAGVLIRLALCRYAALSQRRTSDNLSRCGQELHLTSGNQMPLVLAGCRGCLHGSSSAQPSDYPGCREQKPSLTAASSRATCGSHTGSFTHSFTHRRSERRLLLTTSLRLVQDDVVQDELAQAARISARA